MAYTVPKLEDYSHASLDRAVRELLAAVEGESHAVAGENEFASGTIQIKNLSTATSQTVPLTPDASELVSALQSSLAAR